MTNERSYRKLYIILSTLVLFLIFAASIVYAATELPNWNVTNTTVVSKNGHYNFYVRKNGNDYSVRHITLSSSSQTLDTQTSYTVTQSGSGEALTLPSTQKNNKTGVSFTGYGNSTTTHTTTSYSNYSGLVMRIGFKMPKGYYYYNQSAKTVSGANTFYPENKAYNTPPTADSTYYGYLVCHLCNTCIAPHNSQRYNCGGMIINLKPWPYSYTINNGGTGASANGTYTIESNAITLSPGTKTGYSPSPSSYSIPKGSIGNKTYSITWSANNYTVTLNKNNIDSGSSQGSPSVTATYASNMPAITRPTRPGYTFQGYFDTSAATGGTQYYKADGTSARTWNKASAATLYARWTANTKTYVFNKNATDATGSSTQSFTAGVSGNSFANTGISRPGYTLIGWSETSGSNNSDDYAINANVTNSMIGTGGTTTLYAVWEPDEGFIEFSPNGGDGYMDDQEYTYDNTLNLDELAFDNEGYRFTSWNTQRDGSGDSFSNMAGIKRAFPNIKTQRKVKLYAQWEPLDYKIHFDGNNETSGKMKDQKAFMDEETTLNESDFYKKGFVQKEWNTKPDGTGIGYEDEESIRINSNLLNGTDNPELNNTGQWKNGHFYYATVNTATARRVVEVNDSPIEGINKAFEIDGGGNYDIAQARVPVITGKTYTVSVYAKGSGTLNLQFGNGTYQNKTNEINHDDWKRYTFTFTAGTGGSSTDNYTNIYVGNRSSNSSDTIQVIGFKLEEGNTATQYLPKNNPNFTLYSIWAKGNFTLSGDTSVEGYQFEKIQTENGELKVDTGLSHNKFFSIFDLDRGAEYQISEDKDKLYAPSYEAEEGREYVDKKTDKAERNNDLSTPEETLEGNMGYHFNNERDDKAEGKNITVKKRVSGDGVTNEDKNRLFEFDYHITELDPEYKYRLITDTGEISLSPDSNGIVSGMVSIKHNESFTIAGLPEGAKYSIVERATNNWEYKSSYEVTEGTELVNSVSSVGITSLPNGLNSVYGLSINQSGELNSLGLGVETIPEEEGDIEYLFRNSKAENHNLTVKKQVDIDGETDVDSNDEFTVNMSFANLMPNTAYTASNPNYNFTSDANGKAEVTLTIKGKEEITFFNIPGDVEYTAEEEESDYTADVKVYNESDDMIYETSGMYGAGVSVDNQDSRISSEEEIGLNSNDTILFTNSKKLHNDLKVSKITDGRGVKPNDEFDYTINFTGLEMKEYEIEKLTTDENDVTTSETLSFTPNQPNCSYDFTLKDNQTLWFKGISNTATYKITEHESDGYAPSYNLIEGVAETESGYAQEGESLSSGTETLPTDAEYSFVNVKDTPPPKKFVSDNDNKTWEGTGEEKDVTENTVPDQKSEWEYKITQKVYPGYESFTFRDKIAPNLHITSADDVNVKWTKEDGTVLNQTFTADPDDDEMFTSENFSMEVSSDSIFVESDDPIIGEGGQFEITFKVKINPNSTLDDFREYGQVYRVNERLVFKNNAKTTLDDEEHTTNLVKTYVPLDTSLKINKNVTGNLGDLTKEFEYELKLTGLKPDKKYNYEKPTYVRVAAEYDVSERVNIEATDENSEPVSDVQVNIFEISFNDNGEEIKTPYAKRKTNAEGKTSFLLEPGDYYYEYSYDGETISGYFSSDFYSDDTTFEGDVGEIEELFLPRTDYDTDKYFITDENGEAVIDFKLKDDQSMHLTGLPLGIGYQITEKASNHTPSYRVVRGADSVESPSDSREDKEEELSTPEEKLDESTEYTFTNHRELEPTTSANTFLWILIIIVLTALMMLVKKHLNKADEMDF